MHRKFALLITLGLAFLGGWSLRAQSGSRVAVVYFWKAKSGKLDAYNHYIQAIATPIDEDARRHNAYISLTTFISRKPDGPWTHMRVFVLKDREQAANLARALDEAGARMQPDETKRKANQELSATLRDFVAEEDLDILE